MQGDNTGMHIAHIQVFPLHSWKASRWNKWAIVFEEDKPSLWLCWQPICLMVSTASWIHPPKVFTTRGTKAIPVAWQAFWSEARFLLSATLRAWPWVTDASWIVSFCNGEIIQSHLGLLDCHASSQGGTGQQDESWLQKSIMVLPS